MKAQIVVWLVSVSISSLWPQSREPSLNTAIIQVPAGLRGASRAQALLLLIPPQDMSQGKVSVKKLATDAAIITNEVSIHVLDGKDVRARALVGISEAHLGMGGWILKVGPQKTLGQGVGIPEVKTLIALLHAHGHVPALPGLLASVGAHPDVLTLRIRLIECLADRSRRIISAVGREAQIDRDQEFHGALARALVEFLHQEDWWAGAARISKSLQLLGGTTSSPAIRKACETGVPIIRSRCAEDPADFRSGLLGLTLASLMGEPPPALWVGAMEFCTPPGTPGVTIPPELPLAAHQYAVRTGRWREVVPILRTFWELSGRGAPYLVIEGQGDSRLSLLARQASVAWKGFGLPYLEALCRSGQGTEVESLLSGLDACWRPEDPLGTAIRLATEAGQKGLAKRLQQLNLSFTKDVPPSLLLNSVTIFASLQDQERAQALADQLGILGVESVCRELTPAWKAYLQGGGTEPVWYAVDLQGRMLQASETWGSPETTARQILGRGPAPAWDRARSILRERPQDPEALASLAVSLHSSAQLSQYRAPHDSNASRQSGFDRLMPECLDAVDRLFRAPRLATGLTWVVRTLSDLPGTWREQGKEVAERAIRALEPRLRRTPDDEALWTAWARLHEVVQRAPEVRVGDLQSERTGLGVVPPPRIWGELARAAANARAWEVVPKWLLPILEEDLSVMERTGIPFRSNSEEGRRWQVGAPLVVSHLVRDGAWDRLEVFLKRARDQGAEIQGMAWADELPSEQRHHLQQLLEGIIPGGKASS